MSAMTDYLESQLREHIFRTGTFAKPATLYVALFTSAPGEAGGGTEVSGGGYQRAAAPNGTTVWAVDPLDAGKVSNAVSIVFPQPATNWGTVGWFVICDAATGGNRLFHAALETPRLILAGDVPPRFLVGALSVQFR